jgi:hypothetical protein
MSLSLQQAEVQLARGLGAQLPHRLRASPPLPRSQAALSGASVHGDSLTGVAHGITSTILAPVTAGLGAAANVGLAAIDTWVLSGARAALREAAGVIGATTAPQLESAWFSSEYWRIAGFAALLTVPFLFAAAVQAIVASDLALLLRAAFCYLPLALLAVALAAPLTMLLLAATDQMCAAVSAAGSAGGARFLTDTATLGGVDPLGGTAFLAFAVGALTVAGALALAIEMLIREAAVYVVVLMLPLAFAAFVWPARRIWAVRTLELLIALILSKFAIVAVLSLAGAAFGSAGGSGPARLLTAMALVILAAFAPWGIVRLLPFTELASGAAAEIRSTPTRAKQTAGAVTEGASLLSPLGSPAEWTQGVPATMADEARAAGQTDHRGEDARPLDTGGSLRGGWRDSDPMAEARERPPTEQVAQAAERDEEVSTEPASQTSRAPAPQSVDPVPTGRDDSHRSSPNAPVDYLTAALETENMTREPFELGRSGVRPRRSGPPDSERDGEQS